MIKTYDFMKTIFDHLPEHVVVIDQTGSIQLTNRSWGNFGVENGYQQGNNWTQLNYLDVCDASARVGDEFGLQAAQGIRKVIAGQQNLFYFEYPCHSPDEKRWYMMRTVPLHFYKENFFVISHYNITERKLAEEAVLNLARMDGLTGIANRRYYDTFLHEEWQRCARLNLPLSLALMDIDHFKLLNDTLGHPTGDHYLIEVAHILSRYTKRPGDLCARYGGEEFSLILSGTALNDAYATLTAIQEDIRALQLPNPQAPTAPTLTTSIGLVTVYPSKDSCETSLLYQADQLLYQAKHKGRNRIECDCELAADATRH